MLNLDDVAQAAYTRSIWNAPPPEALLALHSSCTKQCDYYDCACEDQAQSVVGGQPPIQELQSIIDKGTMPVWPSPLEDTGIYPQRLIKSLASPLFHNTS